MRAAVRPALDAVSPLSIQGGIGTDFTLLSIHLLGMSSILGSINIIATILNMRAPA